MIKNINEYFSTLYNGVKDPNLDIMRYLSKKFNVPESKYIVIHIAGTNGKGSVTEMISNILFKQGYTVGKYMSPHLIKFNERICVNNEQIKDEEILNILNMMESSILKYESEFGKQATFFEVTTMMAFIYFQIKKCDFAVIETGLGGAYDCTNIVEPIISVINAIGYDHMKILGNTLKEIAENKAGIIKRNSNTLYIKQENDEVNKVIENTCKDKNNTLHLLNEQNINNYSYNMEYQKFDYKGHKDMLVNLKGKKQVSNAMLAIECIDVLKNNGYMVEEDSIKQGLRSVIHKGRFEVIYKNPTIIYDGGHNEDAINNFKNLVDMYYKDSNRVYIFTALKRKDYTKILNLLLQDESATFIFHDGIESCDNKEFEYTTKEELYDIAKTITKNDKMYKMSLKEAINNVKQNCKDSVIFIVGSFYIYGETMNILWDDER